MTSLRRATDGIFDKVSPEQSVTSDPFISALNIKTIPEAEIPPSLEVELYGPKAYPAIHTGDRWVYEFSDRTASTGSIKFKKLALGVKVTEDEFNQKSATVLRDIVEKELKVNNDYLRANIQQWLCASQTYDGKFIPLLTPSTTGTLSDPKDMGDQGDAESNYTDFGTTNWSGTAQTANVITSFTLGIRKLFASIMDDNTLRYPMPTSYTMVVHPIFKAILDNNHDIWNTTSNVASPNTMTQDLAARGFNVVESVYVDSDFACADGDETTAAVYADMGENAILWLGVPTDGAGWDDWTMIDNGEVKFAVKRKKALFACENKPFLIDDTWYKACIPFVTTPYEQS